MGGLLSGEVALLGQSPIASETASQHHILGTINLDTPFLGIHPGVIGSGIGSLFRPAPDTSASAVTTSQDNDLSQAAKLRSTDNDRSPVMQDPAPSSENSDFTNGQSISLPTESDSTDVHQVPPFLSPTNDPNYNPPFPNDVRVASRKGWENALHFVNKHSDSLMRATRSYVTSYFEFGGCLADYNGLKNRYSRLRVLEESEHRRRNGQRRVRFVNYYTASTGRPKGQKSRSASLDGAGTRPDQHSNADIEARACDQRLHDVGFSTPETRSRSTSPRISVTDLMDDQFVPEIAVDYEDIPGAHPRKAVSGSNAASKLVPAVGPASMPDETGNEVLSGEALPCATSKQDLGPHDSTISLSSHSEISSLPPIPPQPQAPAAFDPTLYPERDARKLAEKNHSRQVKAYQRAIKDRDNAIKDRRKLIEKREKAAQQSREKQLKHEGKKPKAKKKKVGEEEEDDDRKKEPTPTHSRQSECVHREGKTRNDKPSKPKRDKKFCMLPPKTSGETDPYWVRVYMPGVDEVGAHCGLFFATGEHYEWLVRDVGERIQDWVLEQR